MTTILGIIAVCVLVGRALVVAVCFGSKYIEEETRVLPSECETQTTSAEKSWIERYQEESIEKANKLVASDIECFLLPQLKLLLDRLVDHIFLDIYDGELRVTTFDFKRYDYRYKISNSIAESYYLYALHKQLNEMGFCTDYFENEDFEYYIMIYC